MHIEVTQDIFYVFKETSINIKIQNKKWVTQNLYKNYVYI